MKMNLKQQNKEQATAELIKVAHGVSMLFRFGSDRVANTESFIKSNAEFLTDLETSEFHPDAVRVYRRLAAASI
jgi:hypothetical protein